MEFLQNNKCFSFKTDGKNAWDLKYKAEVNESENTTTTVYSFENGLKVTNITKKYEKFNAYEWVNYFENTSDHESEIISDLLDCDIVLPLEYEEKRRGDVAYLPNTETATKLYALTGSVWSAEEFYCDMDKIRENQYVNHLYVDETKEFSTSGGRSSEKNAPFFNVFKNGRGYVFAIGWSGQWNCKISRSCDAVAFKSKIEDTCFRLKPGEKIRTSSVVVMAYEGNFIESQNKWRRLVKKEISIIGKQGRPAQLPLCAGIWGGMKESSVLERIHKIQENKIPFEYIWMDAGWYGKDTKPTRDEFEGNWWCHTGEWCVSPHIFPNGLEKISKAAENAGMKFLLWFEPERVYKSVPVVKEHPEYFLQDSSHADSVLLNLGNTEAWKYCYTVLAEKIEKLNIGILRIDYNISPLSFWRTNDKAGEIGITEIRYVNGLYKLWDALLEQFPNIMIDNCASGGRRIDMETLKRSVPLWRSDLQCPANFNVEETQCQNQNFNLWIPYSGTGTGRAYDEYRIRSCYAAGMTTNYSFSERDSFADTAEKIEFLKKYTAEYLKIRPYFSENFYPLTEASNKKDIWCANQFDRPAEKDGVVQVFRRESSPYETACFALSGIHANAEYLFTDADGGSFVVSGDTLKKEGLKINIPEKRKAKIYFYREMTD